MGPGKVIDALISGAHNNTSAGAAIGTLGIIIGGIVLSGLGLKFSAVLIEFAGGSLFFTVVLVTIISIIIGMGSSTTGSYIILAVVAAPALIQLGVPEIPAHLVVFYAACLSNITPPVCVSAFAAAAIAGADPMRTGFAALKFGVTLVLIPFSFVYAPGLLLIGSTFDVVTTALGYLFGYLALAMMVQSAEPVRGPIAIWQRVALGAAAFCLLFPTSIWVDLAGLVLLAVGWAPSLIGKRPALPASPRQTAD
jgi:TRAP-type uncharacterized transport system fused permease subunit